MVQYSIYAQTPRTQGATLRPAAVRSSFTCLDKSFSVCLLRMADGEDFDVIDPFPDVHALFLRYNRLYFEDQLGACSVEWSSSRMTL